MINLNHSLKVASAWITVVYVVCYLGVALLPGIRSGFMMYALHTNVNMGQNIFSLGTFISGLIIWNIIALLVVWLFVALHNGIKK